MARCRSRSATAATRPPPADPALAGKLAAHRRRRRERLHGSPTIRSADSTTAEKSTRSGSARRPRAASIASPAMLWCADAGDAETTGSCCVTPGVDAHDRSFRSRARAAASWSGYVSRDARLPDIQGALVFGDACSTTLQACASTDRSCARKARYATLPAALAGFGEDAAAACSRSTRRDAACAGAPGRRPLLRFPPPSAPPAASPTWRRARPPRR